MRKEIKMTKEEFEKQDVFYTAVFKAFGENGCIDKNCRVVDYRFLTNLAERMIQRDFLFSAKKVLDCVCNSSSNDVFCWNGCIFADGMELNKITTYKDAELYINFSA